MSAQSNIQAAAKAMLKSGKAKPGSTLESIARDLQIAKDRQDGIFSTDDFIWDKVSKEMSAEASSLGDMFGNSFQVRSAHTGKLSTFVFLRNHYDGSHEDILHFEYIPACPADVPNVKRVIIFND